MGENRRGSGFVPVNESIVEESAEGSSWFHSDDDNGSESIDKAIPDGKKRSSDLRRIPIPQEEANAIYNQVILKVKGPLYVINDGSDDSSSLFSDSDSGSFRPGAYKALCKSDSLSSG